jgi:hypothetical protein
MLAWPGAKSKRLGGIEGMQRNDGKFKLKHGDNRHCEEHLRRSNPWRGKETLDCFVAEFIIGPAEGGTRWLLAQQ